MRDAGTLMNLARGAKAAALLCFLLPWVTVSCSGRPVARITGLGLATGEIEPAGTLPSIPGLGSPDRMFEALGRMMRPDLLVACAAVAIVVGLILSFALKRRGAALAGLAGALTALVLIGFDIFVALRRMLESQQALARSSPGGDLGRGMDEAMRQVLDNLTVRPAIGFWVTIAALAAAAILFRMVYAQTAMAVGADQS